MPGMGRLVQCSHNRRFGNIGVIIRIKYGFSLAIAHSGHPQLLKMDRFFCVAPAIDDSQLGTHCR
jgi:hypothetical protein